MGWPSFGVIRQAAVATWYECGTAITQFDLRPEGSFETRVFGGTTLRQGQITWKNWPSGTKRAGCSDWLGQMQRFGFMLTHYFEFLTENTVCGLWLGG